MEEIDSVDLKLLRALARNSRTPLKELGRELGLSISGVRRRINKLIKKGVIKGYSIVVDPKKYGWNITAFIKIDIESAYLKELMNRLARKREVCEVHKTGGDSILIKVRFRDIDELNRFVEDITASGEGVKNVATFISMECFKETPVSI